MLVTLLCVAGTALAQEPNRDTESLVNRMKDRLKLSEDQVAQVREILSKEAEDRTKMDDARMAKINELLDEEQKKLYGEMRRGRGFGGQGGGRQGPLNMNDLKRDLSLTDEQVEKIKPIVDEFGSSLQKRMEELRNGGFQGLDWQAAIQKFQDSFKEVSEKIKAHLNDEQKSKADALFERVTNWTRLIPGLAARRAGGTETTPGRRSPEERIRRAMDALKIEKDEERDAIKDLVEKIAKAQAGLEDWQKESRERLTETARNKELSDAALDDRIIEAQEERRKREKEIVGLQEQLIEVVNNRQELDLMVQGILR